MLRRLKRERLSPNRVAGLFSFCTQALLLTYTFKQTNGNLYQGQQPSAQSNGGCRWAMRW
jgi:hypothetical protein